MTELPAALETGELADCAVITDLAVLPPTLEPTLEPVPHEPALDGCLEGPAGIWLVTLLDGFSYTFDGALGPAAAEATGAAASLAGRAIVPFPAGSSSTGNETS